jgi:ribosome assembly protein 4
VRQPQALFRVAPVTRCSSALAGHADAVLAVSFSPDGARRARSAQRTTRTADTLPAHSAGKHLASGGGDATVRFWDLAREGPAAQCAGHKGWVQVICWAPDASMVASGGMDGEVRLWQPRKGTASVALLKGHKKGVTSLAWEPAHLALPCRRIASGGRDKVVKIWDATLKRCLLTLSSHTNVVSALKWGGDGLLYSASRDTSILVWETTECVLRLLLVHCSAASIGVR